MKQMLVHLAVHLAEHLHVMQEHMAVVYNTVLNSAWAALAPCMQAPLLSSIFLQRPSAGTWAARQG